jgi:hypothetical protein
MLSEDATSRFQATHSRHAKIADEEAYLAGKGFRHLERPDAILGQQYDVVLLQRRVNKTANRRIVVHDEDRGGFVFTHDSSCSFHLKGAGARERVPTVARGF